MQDMQRAFSMYSTAGDFVLFSLHRLLLSAGGYVEFLSLTVA